MGSIWLKRNLDGVNYFMFQSERTDINFRQRCSDVNQHFMFWTLILLAFCQIVSCLIKFFDLYSNTIFIVIDFQGPKDRINKNIELFIFVFKISSLLLVVTLIFYQYLKCTVKVERWFLSQSRPKKVILLPRFLQRVTSSLEMLALLLGFRPIGSFWGIVSKKSNLKSQK